MALSDYRINSFTKPVSALDDKPQMSAAQLKEWFDSNSTKELKESVNGLIDELGEALSGKVDTADGKDLSSNDYTDEDKAKVHEHANKAVLDKITAAPALATENLPRISWEAMDTFDGEVAVVEKVENTMDSDTPIWTDNEGMAYYSGYHYEYNYILMQHIKYCAQVYDDGNNASRDGFDERTQILYCPDGSVKMRTGDTYDNTSFTWTDWQTIGVPVNAADKAKVDKIDTLQSAVNVISDKVFRESPKTWADVQSIVRAGLANEYFSIGDQLTCSHDTYGTLTWDIIGIDCETPADTTKTHSLTLQLHRLCTTFVFDASEALYYADTELAAGTYNFTLLSGYDTAYGGGKTYQFTLANVVPAGGQIMFPWKYNTQAADTKISTYASKTSLTPIETVSVTEGSGGTALTSTNHTHCVRYGSNRWSKSLVRQWLNSTADAGAWWTPQSNYDRPIERVNTEAGFLKGINADFLSVIGSVKKSTAKNQITEGGGAEILDEKIFLPSAAEVYGTNGGSEGNPYPYYSQNSSLSGAGGGADTNRIKYLGSTAEKWWLRSCHQFSGNYMRHVTVTGAIETNNPPNSYGITPVCAVV